MKKGLFRVLTLFLVLGTMFMPVLAEDEESQSDTSLTNVVLESGKYLGYSKLDCEVNDLYYIFDGTQESVAYCMNAKDYSPAPIINKDNSFSYANEWLRPQMIYSKGDATLIDDRVRSVLYYGYPNRTTEGHSIDDRVATQLAVWYFTDDLEYSNAVERMFNKQQDLKGRYVGNGDTAKYVRNVYNQLIASPLISDTNVELQYYTSDSRTNNSTVKTQDLLAVKINVADTFTPSLASVSIGATKLVDDAIPVNGQSFTFVLKDNEDKFVASATNNGQEIKFNLLLYTTESVTYELSELIPEGDSLIDYDETVYTVNVAFDENKQAIVTYANADGQSADVDSVVFRNKTKQQEESTDTGETTINHTPTSTPESTPSSTPSSTPVPVKEETVEETPVEETPVEETPTVETPVVVEQNNVVTRAPYIPNTGDEMEIMKWGRALAASLALGMLNGVILKKYH